MSRNLLLKGFISCCMLIILVLIAQQLYPLLPFPAVPALEVLMLALLIGLWQVSRDRTTSLDKLTGLNDDSSFASIADQIPFMVWRSDSDGKCIYVNKQWMAFTGISYEDSLGFGFAKAMNIPENSGRRSEWQEMVQNRQPYELKFQLRDASGNLHWVLAQANAYFGKDGFQGYIGSIIDITQQEDAHIAMQELSDRKDEFLSIASHELKTPMTSIKALIQLMQRSIAPDQKAFGFLERTNKNVIRLEKLISNLLDVSKINAGKLNYDLQEFPFDEMVREVVSGMQHITPGYELVVQKAEPVRFMGDRFRIEQVMYNFISNAVKYSPQGGKVLITQEVSNHSIVVSVQDFGIGIAKENLEQIFNRYYRVDNTLMKFEGLGLGLFISSEIIKRHNGSFWIESEIDKGSTFYFILPLHDKGLAQEPETDQLSFYRDDKISMALDTGNNWMRVNWTGYQNLKTVQEGCMIMLDLVKKNKCRKVLNDNTHVLGNWSEASDWGASEWFPAMASAGITHFAWIYSPSIFSKLAAEKSVDVLLSGITIQFFNSKADAERWLSEI